MELAARLNKSITMPPDITHSTDTGFSSIRLTPDASSRKLIGLSEGCLKDEERIPTIDDGDEAMVLAHVQYNHLKVLVDFTKADLGHVLRLRAEIKASTLRQIQFVDLWHLFEPGDLVYAPADDGSAQLFKAYFVSGGQSLKRPPTRLESQEYSNTRSRASYFTPRHYHEGKEEEVIIEEMLREEGSNMGTWTPFKVDSYHMQFDGERCGPVEVCHKIWPFEGEQDITNLTMYPLRFHKAGDEVLKALIQRGNELLFEMGYKSYDGQSCYLDRGKSQVTIQGDVYVDATAYYQDFPAAKPRIGRVLRSRQNAAEVEELCTYLQRPTTSTPNPQATKVALRLSGHELDAKLSDDFMTIHRMDMKPFVPEAGRVSDDILALMPHLCHGFSFQLRKWCK